MVFKHYFCLVFNWLFPRTKLGRLDVKALQDSNSMYLILHQVFPVELHIAQENCNCKLEAALGDILLLPIE